MMWWTIILFFPISYLISAQNVDLVFLKAVPRLQRNSIETSDATIATDYYFSCNVEGRFLQWQYNNEPLSGFRINDDIGKFWLDERSDYTYIINLLSSQRVKDFYNMSSILVMSFHNGSDPGQFNVTCFSDMNNSLITAGNVSHVKNSVENGEIQLDYVVSGNVSNRYRTHIFMCRVRHTPQYIEVTGRTLGFSSTDDVGQATTIFLNDRNTTNVQGIFIKRGSYEALTLILVNTKLKIANLSCYNNVSYLSLLSLEKSELENNPEVTTAILEISVGTAESLNVTESMTHSYNPFEPSDNLIVSTLVPFIIVVVAITIAITIIVIKRNRSQPVEGSFVFFQEQTSLSDKTRATVPLAVLSQNSQLLKPVEDASSNTVAVLINGRHNKGKNEVIVSGLNESISKDSESIEVKKNNDSMPVGVVAQGGNNSKNSDNREINLKERDCNSGEIERVTECRVCIFETFMLASKLRRSNIPKPLKANKSGNVSSPTKGYSSSVSHVKPINYVGKDTSGNSGRASKIFMHDELRPNPLGFIADYEPMEDAESMISERSLWMRELINIDPADAVPAGKTNMMIRQRFNKTFN